MRPWGETLSTKRLALQITRDVLILFVVTLEKVPSDGKRFLMLIV